MTGPGDRYAGIGPRLLPRVGVTPMAVGSLLVMAAGSALFAVTLHPGRSYPAAVLPGMLVVAAGMGFVFPAFMSAAVAGVPDRQQGLASGLVNTAQQVGAALGLAVLVAVAAAAAPTEETAEALAGSFRVAFAAAAVVAAVAAAHQITPRLRTTTPNPKPPTRLIAESAIGKLPG